MMNADRPREPTRPPGRRLAARAAGLALVAALALFALLLRQPLDLGATVALPNWLERLARRDEVAYSAHAALGTALEALRFPPEAVGLQWLKAAAHARTAAEAERLGAGLARTRRRSEDPDRVDAALCRYIIGGGTLGQRAAMARAEMRCEPHA
jgi:hypothetical protein